MADEQQENKELEQVDIIDRKMGKVNCMLAIMVNHETLCSAETHYLTNALWGIQDMLTDVSKLQSELLNNS